MVAREFDGADSDVEEVKKEAHVWNPGSYTPSLRRESRVRYGTNKD
jgi:hypothetical protein